MARTSPDPVAPPAQRWDYLDQLRAILMLVGIPYHVGLIYASHAAWIIDSPDESMLVTGFLQFSHTFRMPVFFLLAGFFSMLMIRRQGVGRWFQGRLWRVGVPLLTSLLLISPLIVLATATAQGGFGYALAGLLAEARHPTENWTVHLWFLIYLLAYCGLLALVWQMRGPLRLEWAIGAAQDALERRPWLGWLGLFGLGIATLGTAVVAAALEASYLLGNIMIPALFMADLLVFLAGALLALRLSWLEHFTRPRPVIWVLAVVAATVMSVTQPEETAIARIVTYFLMPIVGVLAAHVLFSAARMWLDRSTAFSREMVQGAMSMYLVHVVFVCWLGLAFLYVPLPALVEFALITVVAFAASWGFHRLVRRSPLLALLFNGVRPAVRAPTLAAAPGQVRGNEAS
ncbi:acyltransferase family protein [Pseudoroseomonas globiformis]|uniref:Acyltransferase family protein n=1 Tax=Teichococcus globiformis TaxID=2307229 RepID=A0ABV7G1C8_9PROT